MSSNARAVTQHSTDNRIPDWIGTNELLGIWLHDLKRARSHFTSALQRFAKLGSSINSRGLTIARSTEHALLLIAFPHIFSEYHMSNPFPSAENEINALYLKHFLPADDLTDDTPNATARAMRVAHIDSANLLAIFPELNRYFIAPDALVAIDIEYGNTILEHITDEGALNELEDICPTGFGTDIMKHLNGRNAKVAVAADGTDFRYAVPLEHLNKILSSTISDSTTIAFETLYASILKHRRMLPKLLRRSDLEITNFLRNQILYHTTADIKVTFRGLLRDKAIKLDDMIGTVDCIREVLGDADIASEFERLRSGGHGLAAQGSDPPKDRRTQFNRDDKGDPTKKPPSPCPRCKRLGKGEHMHWLSLCPHKSESRPPPGRAAMAFCTEVEEEPEVDYGEFFEAEEGAIIHLGTQKSSSALVAVAQHSDTEDFDSPSKLNRPTSSPPLAPAKHPIHARTCRTSRIGRDDLRNLQVNDSRDGHYMANLIQSEAANMPVSEPSTRSASDDEHPHAGRRSADSPGTLSDSSRGEQEHLDSSGTLKHRVDATNIVLDSDDTLLNNKEPTCPPTSTSYCELHEALEGDDVHPVLRFSSDNYLSGPKNQIRCYAVLEEPTRPASPLTLPAALLHTTPRPNGTMLRVMITKLCSLYMSVGVALLSFVAYVYATRGAGAPPATDWPHLHFIALAVSALIIIPLRSRHLTCSSRRRPQANTSGVASHGQASREDTPAQPQMASLARLLFKFSLSQARCPTTTTIEREDQYVNHRVLMVQNATQSRNSKGQQRHQKLLIVDSGASFHIHRNADDLVNLRPCDDTFKGVDRVTHRATCIGDLPIVCQDHHGQDVRASIGGVRIFPKVNDSLISVSQLWADGRIEVRFGKLNGIVVKERPLTYLPFQQENGVYKWYVSSDSRGVSTANPQRSHPTLSQPAPQLPSLTSDMPPRVKRNGRRVLFSGSLMAHSVRATSHMNDYSTEVAAAHMHRRLHAGVKRLRLLPQLTADAPPRLAQAREVACEHCMTANAPNLPHSGARYQASHAGRLIHSDIAGPFLRTKIGHHQYLLVLVDDHTRFKFSYPIRTRSDAPAQIRVFVAAFNALASNAGGDVRIRPISTLLNDKAGEFVSHDFRDFLTGNLIQPITCPAEVHALNGVAERAIRSIMEQTRSLMVASNAPVGFWNYAALQATDVLNRTTTPPGADKSSYEMLTGVKPRILCILPFGCRMFAVRPRQGRHKTNHDPRAWAGINLGRSIDTPGAYCIWVPDDNKVVTTSEAYQVETVMPWQTPDKRYAADPPPLPVDGGADQPVTLRTGDYPDPQPAAPLNNLASEFARVARQSNPTQPSLSSSARDSRAVLVLFSGPKERPDGLIVHLRRLGFAVTAVDNDPKHGGDERDDILRDVVYESLLRRCQRGEFFGVMAAPPCSTFSIARFIRSTNSPDGGPPPVRTRAMIRGVDDVPQAHRKELRNANSIIARTASILQASAEAGAEFIVENPADRGDPSSTRLFIDPMHGPLWLMPEIIELEKTLACRKATFPQCVFGADVLKYTTLLYTPGLHTVLGSLDGLVCPHAEGHLTKSGGSRTADGVWNSAEYAAYPSELNRALAQAFATVANGVSQLQDPLLPVEKPTTAAPLESPAPASPPRPDNEENGGDEGYGGDPSEPLTPLEPSTTTASALANAPQTVAADRLTPDPARTPFVGRRLDLHEPSPALEEHAATEHPQSPAGPPGRRTRLARERLDCPLNRGALVLSDDPPQSEPSGGDFEPVLSSNLDRPSPADSGDVPGELLATPLRLGGTRVGRPVVRAVHGLMAVDSTTSLMVEPPTSTTGEGEILADPRNRREAMAASDRDKWLEAEHAELENHDRNGSFVWMDHSAFRREAPGRRLVRLTWVYKRKRSGALKARLCVQGCSQVPGVDFDQTFCGTLRPSSLRLLAALASRLKLHMRRYDFVSAFLQGTLEEGEVVYCEAPPGHGATGEDGRPRVCKVVKPVYGMAQAGRRWQRTLFPWLRGEDGVAGGNLTQCESDPSVFFRRARPQEAGSTEDCEILVVGVYVDDLFILYSRTGRGSLFQQFIDALEERWDVEDEGEVSDLLNVEIMRTEGGFVILRQRGYIDKLVLSHAPDGKVPSSHQKNRTPCAVELPQLVLDATSRNATPDARLRAQYMSLVGALLYCATHTRPDIAFAVGMLSRAMHCPDQSLYDAALRVLYYLARHRDVGLRYGPADSVPLYGMSDSDWAVRHSTSGSVFVLSAAAVSWSSRRQVTIALSSCEAEIMAASDAAKEAVYLGSFLRELGIGTDEAIKLGVDNTAARDLAYNPQHHERTKHIARRHFFIREMVENGQIVVPFVRSADNLADFFTKPLPASAFFPMRNRIMNIEEKVEP